LPSIATYYFQQYCSKLGSNLPTFIFIFSLQLINGGFIREVLAVYFIFLSIHLFTCLFYLTFQQELKSSWSNLVFVLSKPLLIDFSAVS
jgi:hypothetical protein